MTGLELYVEMLLKKSAEAGSAESALTYAKAASKAIEAISSPHFFKVRMRQEGDGK